MKHLKTILMAVLTLSVAFTLAACNKTTKTTKEQVTTTNNGSTTTAAQVTTTTNAQVTTTAEQDEFEPAVVYSGSVSGEFVYDEDEDMYSATITLEQWGNIQIDYEKDETTSITIWYDNTEISGDVTTEELDGCDWTNKLYHEGDSKSFFCYIPSTYELIYDPVQETLYVGIVVIEEEDAAEPTDETFDGAFAVAKWNTETTEYAVVYDSAYTGTIALGEYTIATDATGKIVFASRTSDGYGGPADTFYHDGSYSYEAGKVCGIYSLDENFAPWPAEYNGVNAWTLYTVVCPTGYHIITGSKAQMAKVIKKIANVTSFDSASNNELFELTIVNGSLDKFEFTYENGTCCTGIKIVEKEVSKPEALVVTTDGTAVQAFAKAEGVYTGVYTLTGWNSISITYSDGNGNDITVWYDNTTITGAVTSAETEGCGWNENLYHEGTEKKWFHYGDLAPTTYKLVYNPTANTLEVSVARATGLTASTDGEEVQAFAEADGVYTGVYTLTGWNSISITYSDGNGNDITVWYDNTTITGAVTSAETEGCGWNENLYHEGTEKKWFHYGDLAPTTYKITYNPTANTLEVSVVVPAGLNATTAGTAVQAFALNDGVYTGVYTLSGWNSISLTYSDGNGNVITVWYDNTTISGNVTGAAADGCSWTQDLYHEGTDKAWYHYGDVEAKDYEFVYNPTANTLTISIVKEQGTVTVSTTGTEVKAMALAADGVFYGEYTLNQWNNISVAYNSQTLWYDSATILGDVVEKTTESTYGQGILYIDNGIWYRSEAGAQNYVVSYNPSTNTLAIVKKGAEAGVTATNNGGVTVFTKNSDGTYTGTITLGEWGHIYLEFTDENGNAISIWYNTCTITGNIMDATTNGTDWSSKLYHEANGGSRFYSCTGGTYTITYNPATNTLTVA